jgi:hypothetical protein
VSGDGETRIDGSATADSAPADTSDDDHGSGGFQFDLGSALERATKPVIAEPPAAAESPPAAAEPPAAIGPPPATFEPAVSTERPTQSVSPGGDAGSPQFAPMNESAEVPLPVRGAAQTPPPSVQPPTGPMSEPMIVAGGIEDARPSDPSAPAPIETAPSLERRDVSAPDRGAASMPGIDPAPAPLPRRNRSASTPNTPEPAASVQTAGQMTSVPVLDDEMLPRRGASAPVSHPAPAEPVRPVATRAAEVAGRSVFDDAAPAPALPAMPTAQPARPMQRPVISSTVAQTLPKLPKANPVVAPIVVESAADPLGPDLQAVRSFQRRAQRATRRSKIFGHSFLSFLVLAGLVGAALVFGRPLLFPNAWDAELTPVVDRVQTRTGVEFSGVVPLRELPDREYASIALPVGVGTDWSARFAEWRALGIASGDGNSVAVIEAVVALRPAVYDPISNTIYRASGADPDALPGAYEAALHEVFHRQQATPPNDDIDGAPNPVLGVSTTRQINSRALDRALSGSRSEPRPMPADSQAPLPLLYELGAVDRLGDPLRGMVGTGVLAFGDVYPDLLLDATSSQPARAIGGLPPADADSLADPIALGDEAWSLVWSNRLPAATVDRLSSLIVADAYRPVQRADKVCVIADFQTTSVETTSDVVAAVSRWALAAPIARPSSRRSMRRWSTPCSSDRSRCSPRRSESCRRRSPGRPVAAVSRGSC